MGELAVACYGRFLPRQPRSGVADLDFSYLLHDRSAAMGWLDGQGPPVNLRSTGLWNVYEAEHHLGLESRGSPVLWVRVGIKPVPADQPLPVQPLLRCVDDVAGRIGDLTTVAVQALLPVQQLAAASRDRGVLGPLSTAAWFTHGGPAARTSLQVTLDSGSDPSIPRFASQMQSWLRQVDQDAFEATSVSLSDHPDLAVASTFFDDLRCDSSHHRATFEGTLPEWSLEAVGWLATFLAGVSAWHGVTGPLLLTVSRTEEGPAR